MDQTIPLKDPNGSSLNPAVPQSLLNIMNQQITAICENLYSNSTLVNQCMTNGNRALMSGGTQGSLSNHPINYTYQFGTNIDTDQNSVEDNFLP